MLFCGCNVVKLNCACVHEIVPEPAILAQASQTRLGEICKDSYRTLLEVIAQAKDFGFGREVISLRRAGIPIFLSERMSRSGESLSPKREREECSVVGLTRSSGEKFDFWAKRELA
ncbi:hypothetical protein DEO72_LG8g2087 [Vigna unguiculata]|uniref:Uncharacterized protein n=1 Tax=Vigna unguiculata TaxID=3917 RepID=A0A4D6MTF7_VIGUN|nr:hypothetical protein DEO72_LG8g2087 [Vigna unguiculata]